MARSRKGGAAVATPPQLELPVVYGVVSFGDKTARIGLTVHRGNLTVTQADKLLVGRRLTCTILARSTGHAGQESLPGFEEADPVISGIADVKGIGVGPKNISFGLTFALDGLDNATLSHFSKREGVFTVTEIADIPAGEAGESEGEE